jgi:hypothetical protein
MKLFKGFLLPNLFVGFCLPVLGFAGSVAIPGKETILNRRCSREIQKLTSTELRGWIHKIQIQFYMNRICHQNVHSFLHIPSTMLPKHLYKFEVLHCLMALQYITAGSSVSFSLDANLQICGSWLESVSRWLWKWFAKYWNPPKICNRSSAFISEAPVESSTYKKTVTESHTTALANMWIKKKAMRSNIFYRFIPLTGWTKCCIEHHCNPRSRTKP